MPSVTQPRPSQPPADAQQRFIDGQIRRVRRTLKLVDLTAGLITLVIGVVAYLLTMAVLDHWVISGGWGAWSRAVLFAVLVLGVGWYAWRVFRLLIWQSINPIYAAQTIEQSSPSLKNGLLNLLLLRGRRRQISATVYQAIEQQAAQGLSKVSMESVVDRSAVLRLGYVLVAVVVVTALYLVFSPKDPIASAGRVLLPWSEIAAPSRVQILDVQPGDTSLARGEQLEISAEVHGIGQDIDQDGKASTDDSDSVRLLFSTTDGQTVEQVIPMRRSPDGLRYQCRLPGKRSLSDSQGVQQDLSYWIEAGDAHTERFSVHVFAHPTLVVQKVRYEYPAYTGYPSREVETTGDIRAIEGTRVTLQALANQPIRSAHIDLQADGRRDVVMTFADRRATGSFSLSLRADRHTPKFDSYVLKYTTLEGRTNRHPPKYHIEVLRDYTPEIELLAPEEDVLDVALNDSVQIELVARDPDFALHQVTVQGTVEGAERLQRTLLSQDHTGRYTGKLSFTPEELGLQPGDVLEYWAEASDNRRPEPNLAFTQHRKIRVLGPLESGEQPGGENQQPNDSGNESDDQDQQNEGGEGQEGQPGGTTSGGGEKAEPSDKQEGGGGEGDSQQSPGGEDASEKGPEGAGGESASADAGPGEDDQTTEGEPGGDSPSDSIDPTAGESSPEEDPQGGGEESPGKVSSEGDDDGTAFERISDYLDEQDKQSDQQQSSKGEDASEKDAGDPGSKNKLNDQEPSAQDQGQRESDSEGQQGGDRSGEGQEGGGQKANDEGAGTAGQNQGAGTSPQPGESASADARPGEDEPTNTPTGQSSQNTPGQGSNQSPKTGDEPGGKQPGSPQGSAEGEQQAPSDSDPTGETPSDSNSGQQNGEPSSNQSDQQPDNNKIDSSSSNGSPAGQPQGSGTGSDSDSPPSSEPIAPGDAANLDYAKQQTDLVLERLDDQLRRRQVDKKLLEKLGWNQDELKRFVDRWKNLKSRAVESGDSAIQQQLNEALRSLGLRKHGPTRFEAKTPADQLRDLKDEYRGKTPQEYIDMVREYNKGVAAAREE